MFQEVSLLYGSTTHYDEKRRMDEGRPKYAYKYSGEGSTTRTGQKISRKNSLVVGQKLRESKWFTHEEMNIVCAVLESGFIVQKKDESSEDYRGVALWATGYEKSKNPDYITIHTVSLVKGVYKVQSCNLLNFWGKGTALRINNQSDQTSTPNTEELIREQVLYAQNNKHKWHNSEHFTYWCRYGAPVKQGRTKLVSDSLKWGQFSLTSGLHLLKNRKRNVSTSN